MLLLMTQHKQESSNYQKALVQCLIFSTWIISKVWRSPLLYLRLYLALWIIYNWKRMTLRLVLVSISIYSFYLFTYLFHIYASHLDVWQIYRRELRVYACSLYSKVCSPSSCFLPLLDPHMVIYCVVIGLRLTLSRQDYSILNAILTNHL